MVSKHVVVILEGNHFIAWQLIFDRQKAHKSNRECLLKLIEDQPEYKKLFNIHESADSSVKSNNQLTHINTESQGNSL